MTLRQLNERYGTAAIVVLAVAILLLAFGAWIATCTVERMYPSPRPRRAVTTREIDLRRCPLSLDAARLCLGGKRDVFEMPAVGTASSSDRLDAVTEILEACSDGYVTDEAAASAIYSIGAVPDSRDEPIRL